MAVRAHDLCGRGTPGRTLPQRRLGRGGREREQDFLVRSGGERIRDGNAHDYFVSLMVQWCISDYTNPHGICVDTAIPRPATDRGIASRNMLSRRSNSPASPELLTHPMGCDITSIAHLRVVCDGQDFADPLTVVRIPRMRFLCSRSALYPPLPVRPPKPPAKTPSMPVLNTSLLPDAHCLPTY